MPGAADDGADAQEDGAVSPNKPAVPTNEDGDDAPGGVPGSDAVPTGDEPAMLPLPANPALDTDGDGLTDVDEIAIYGTSPAVADTDGDGFTDHDEIVDKAFDPDTAIAQFNPRVADVPKLTIELVSAPAIAVTYTESSGATRTVGTERSEETSNATTRSWGGSNSHAVEMTHTAGVELGVEHEFGPTGGTTLSATLSYEFSHSTTNEQTVTWSDEQTAENSTALAAIESVEATEGTDLDGGYVQMAARLRNDGHIAFSVEGITLAAYTQDPENPRQIDPMGTLTFLDAGNPTVFPATVIAPGQALPPATFNLNLDLGTTKALLEDSSSLVIEAATGSLNGVDGADFGLAATNINSRTAQLIVDYGVDRPVELYRVAVATNLDQPVVSAKTVFEDYLRIPFESGSGAWHYGEETESRDSFAGLRAVRDVAMSDEDSSYWIVTHTHTMENGASSATNIHNLILDGYNFEDIALSKGDVLHLVYVRDTDRDGLGERSELLHGTDPLDADTDDDGLSDSQEVNGWLIDNAGDELAVTSDPLRVDTDGDTADDAAEFAAGTHPRVSELSNEAPALTDTVFEVQGFELSLTTTLSDADANVAAVTVDWGDGSAQEVVEAPAPGELVLVHEYDAEGEFTVTVLAVDTAGASSEVVSGTVNTTLPTEGLLLHMAMDNSLNAEVGTALENSAGLTYFGTDRHGSGERALDLYGTGQAEQFSLLYGAHLPLSLSFSIGLWVNLDQYGNFNGNVARIAGQGNWFNLFSSGTESGVSFGILDGQSPSAEGPNVAENISLAAGWHFYVGVVEQLPGAQSAVRLYRDGSEVASSVENALFENPGACSFYVGNWSKGNGCDDTEAHDDQGFPGLVDDLRVYQRALSADEVLRLYNERE